MGMVVALFLVPLLVLVVLVVGQLERLLVARQVGLEAGVGVEWRLERDLEAAQQEAVLHRARGIVVRQVAQDADLGVQRLQRPLAADEAVALALRLGLAGGLIGGQLLGLGDELGQLIVAARRLGGGELGLEGRQPLLELANPLAVHLLEPAHLLLEPPHLCRRVRRRIAGPLRRLACGRPGRAQRHAGQQKKDPGPSGPCGKQIHLGSSLLLSSTGSL